ncbi:HlyD family secretion protein [Yunchengibacter salinarum]|uniref:HlyD family secretion protein n=1 Tax=Yunchengibacter salinarum TaxID=3133399 RepID=UPI0035B68A68
MKKQLFRKQVLEHRQRGLEGDVLLITPLRLRIIILLLAALFLGAVLFVTLTDFARTEQVRGYMIPTRGLIGASAMRAGIVQRINVAAGDRVKKGAVLATIFSGGRSGDGRDIAADLMASLARERRTLERQIRLAATSYRADLESLEREKAGLEAELAALERQRDLQQALTLSAKTAHNSLIPLAKKGLVPKAEQVRRKQAWLTEERQLQVLEQSLGKTRETLAGFRHRRARLVAEHESRVADLKGRLTAMDRQRTRQAGNRSVAVVAPTAGRITSVTAMTGNPVQPGKPLLFILPEGSTLEARLLVPSRAMGFLARGQAVRLHYDAFPYERFGSRTGHVTRIGGSILTMRDISAPSEWKNRSTRCG